MSIKDLTVDKHLKYKYKAKIPHNPDTSTGFCPSV